MRSLFHVSSATLLALGMACQPSPDREEGSYDAVTAAIHDGTPESIGVLGLLNAVDTDVPLLDIDVGLDRRAAENLVAHKNGADGVAGNDDDDAFDDVDEVDAIPYVGPSAFDKLLAYAAAHGYVPGDDDLLGVYDGVSFTVKEAQATLTLANNEAHATLDGPIGLDVRAVDSIVAARPIASVLALSELHWVGESALRKLKTHAVGAPTAEAVVEKLEPAVDGLFHTSESDYPFEVVLVEGAGQSPISESNIKERIASIYVARPGEPTLAAREVEVISLSAFFDRYTVPQSWWEPSQHEAAPRFQAVRGILAGDLVDAKVFRLGSSGSIDIYIVGRSSDGHLVGLWTISVET
jgi:hypothetical protein